MYKNSVVITLKYGVHIRIAAEIVRKAEQVRQKYNIKLHIKKLPDNDSIEISGLGLLSLKILQSDVVEIISLEDTAEGIQAVMELSDFLRRMMDEKSSDLTQLDSIIEHAQLLNNQIFESLPMGVVVVDTNASVIMINEYGLKLVHKSLEQVLGKHVASLLPASLLPQAVTKQLLKAGSIQHLDDKVLITNTSTIGTETGILGAVELFQDISELQGMRELNEKFQRILNTSSDLISFVDENRKVSYMNPAYLAWFPEHKDSIGVDLMELSPDGLRMRAFQNKQRFENVVYSNGKVDIVSTVEPLYVENVFKGIVAISKPVSEIRNLMKKLEESEERSSYFQQELARQQGLTRSLSKPFEGIIGASSSLRECLIMAEKAAGSTSTVLVRGESGTGKELIAKAIHHRSNRRDKPFVRVNCAAIPENLLESELFGHEKGAFTGAIVRKPGKFSIADGGTIFLDEIGDLPKHMQSKLLRVLQEREFESVGGIETHHVDVRVLAATNRNLEEMISANEFREDLYYRLNVMSIQLPPLRDRYEDIPLLAEGFLSKFNSRMNKRISGIDGEAIQCLQRYRWPGNIRELENVVERAMNLCEGDVLGRKDMPRYIAGGTEGTGRLINLVEGELASFQTYEKELIQEAMRIYGSYNRAGKALGLTHRTISLKCEKYGIKKE